MTNTRIGPLFMQLRRDYRQGYFCDITANSNTPTCEDRRLLKLGSLRGTGSGHWFCFHRAIENGSGKCKLHHKRWQPVRTKWARYTEN